MHNPNRRSPYMFLFVQLPALLAGLMCGFVFICWVLAAASLGTAATHTSTGGYGSTGDPTRDPIYLTMWAASLISAYGCFSLFRALQKESK